VDTANSRRSVGSATLTTVESMIVMNMPATKTTLTENLGFRKSGQRVVTNWSRRGGGHGCSPRGGSYCE
jgi:hypothetical protein